MRPVEIKPDWYSLHVGIKLGYIKKIHLYSILLNLAFRIRTFLNELSSYAEVDSIIYTSLFLHEVGPFLILVIAGLLNVSGPTSLFTGSDVFL